MLSKISQKEEGKYHMISLICGIERRGESKWAKKTTLETDKVASTGDGKWKERVGDTIKSVYSEWIFDGRGEISTMAEERKHTPNSYTSL